MCVGVPLKVIKVNNDNTALVSIGDGNIQISTIFTEDVKEGDYVLVHAGFALRILTEEHALEIRNLIKEIQDE